MQAPKGFTITEKIYEGASIETHRAVRQEDNKKFILKSIVSELPTAKELSTIQHEYSLLQKFNLPGLIHAEALLPHKNSLVLVLEDIEGITLAQFLNNRPIDLTIFFKIAIQLIEVVESLHKHHIIHKDINPYNIIIEPNTLSTRLTDLSISAEIFEKVETQLSPYTLEGNIAYVSPEQTGRMNRSLDYRTDFYSLGLTFYQMLTGELPFKAYDPVEWVHCHIAKTPPLASHINPRIPEMLALVINKMIEKMPEDRYSSATSLRLDMDECIRQWEQTGTIEPFPLRQRISSDHLYISQKLYGRDVQIESLLSAFERVSHGAGELFLVAGYSGIGKTSLIQEIHKPIVRQHGYFISGKFDPLRRSMPYSAIIQACQSLIKQLLTEPDTRLALLKDEIMAVLGINGQIIINILPELELIIGPQPPVVELQPAEAQNRFTMVFEDFFRVFTQADHPLVIFLDDLQWSDSASLQLIEHILTDIKCHYLLVIGAYRDNEVKADHPLNKTIQNIEEVGIVTNSISLNNLTEHDVEQLLADSLNQESTNVQPLARLIYSKTHGNPFFINQMLKVLNQEQLLFFSTDDNKWNWDIDKIERLAVSDNVVSLTISRLHKLPVITQENLKLAACIGSQFDLQTLSLITQISLRELKKNLQPAFEEGLVKNVGTTYKQLELDPTATTNEQIDKVEYQFIHDRVQHAAYELIPETVRQQTHLRIAHILYENYEKDPTQNVFDILQHYNKALDLITDNNEKLRVAKLNLIAGQKAKESIAYQYALAYLDAGLELLDESYWRKDYDLMFNLYRERSECAYLIGRHEESEKYFDILLANTRTNLEKADIYTIKVILYANRHQHEKSLSTGLYALKLLGINLPLHPTNFHILKEILLIKFKLANKNIVDLASLQKEATEPKTIVASHLLMEMGPAGYIANPKLLALMASKRILINLKDGYCRYSITAYMTYALIIMTRMHNYKEAYAFVDLAGRLAEKVNHLPTLSRYYATLSLWFAHWRSPFSECIKISQTAFRLATDSGDALFAGYSHLSYAALVSTMSTPIPELVREVKTLDETLLRIQDVGFHQFGLYWKSILHYWQGQTNLTLEEIGDLIHAPLQSEAQTITFICHSTYAHLLFTFGEYELALQNFTRAYELRNFALALVWNPDLYMLYGLTIAQNYSKVSEQQKKSFRKIYKTLLKQMKIWTRECAQNFEHKYLLMLAEWERLKGNVMQASLLYDQAIESCQEGGFIQFAAIANELAAKFYIELDRLKFAKLYILESHYNYQRWGADEKAKRMSQEYPDWFVKPKQSLDLTVDTATSSTMNPMLLDFISVLKASQTLSSEIILDNLLRQMIQIMLENAGAERGLILLENNGNLVVAAEGYSNSNDITLTQVVPVNERNDLPLKLISYVKNTQDEVVLSDAGADGRFMSDPYIITKQPKSILCMPIRKQKSLIGVLYLENNLIKDAFKKELLQVLNLLSTQAAISLDNARLYSASEHFVPRAFLQQLNKESLVNVKIGDNVYTEKTIMFCDIRGYTGISERSTPTEVFQFVNNFFAEMEPIIRQYRGFIDKYIGDAIMALFENPDSAIQAAIAMKHQLDSFNKKQNESGKLSINIGIGLNTGELILGIIGNATRMEGTVIGHAVNTASRIQDLTKHYKVALLISEFTEKKLMYPQHYALRQIDEVIIRGQTTPIGIFEVCAIDPPLLRNHKLASLEKFNAARKSFNEKNFKQALDIFESCQRSDLVDTVVEMYIKRCQEMLAASDNLYSKI